MLRPTCGLALVLAGWFLCPSPCRAASIAPGSASPALALSPRDLGAFPAPHGTSPKAGDYLWSDQFGLPSADGSLECAVKFGKDLIVGGSFREIGGISASHIARWDGSAWHPLGNGLEDEVTCLAVYHGALYAGGRFQFVEGQFSPHLASWDGSAWSPVGAFTGSYHCCYRMKSLTVYRDELVAGGDFGVDEPPELRGIRSWNGTSWHALGSGVNGPVQCLTAAGDTLYVAGEFTVAGGSPASRIASWDGTTWRALDSGISGSRFYGPAGVRALAYFKNLLVAGGAFDSAGTVAADGLASWDGASWSTIPGSYSSNVTALGEHQGRLVVASFPDFRFWDGTDWSSLLPSQFEGDPRAFVSDETGLYVVGSFVIGTPYAPPFQGFHAARWDGQAWTVLEPWKPLMHGLATSSGSPAAIRALAPFQGKLAAGGYLEYAGTGSGWRQTENVALWDGAGWDPIPFSPPNGPLQSVEYLLSEADTLYAVGELREYPGWAPTPVLRYTGGAWSKVDTLTAHGMALIRHQGQLFLGAARLTFPGPQPGGVLRWTGRSWESIGTTSGPDEAHGVFTLGEYGGQLVAGGTFTTIDGVPANGIAVWDGVSWRNLGGPGPEPGWTRPLVFAIASYRNQLVIAGSFAGPSPEGLPLQLWDGSMWIGIPGISGSASSMRVARDRLFLGGVLYVNGSTEAVSVAVWNGLKWEALGSATNGWPESMLEYDGALYVGGSFSQAGGNCSFGIARWAGLQSAPPTAPWMSAGRPNPFRGTSQFSYRVGSTGAVRVTVSDVRGRQVATIEETSHAPGTYFAQWDGRDARGVPAPTGVYFVQVQSTQGTTSRKILLLR